MIVTRLNDWSQAATVVAGLLTAALGFVDPMLPAYAGLVTAAAALWGWLIAKRAASFDEPRQLTPEEIAHITQELAGLPRIQIALHAPGNDAEACHLAEQITDVLNGLGWEARRIQQSGARRFPRGELRVIVNDAADAPDHADRLLTAFQGTSLVVRGIDEDSKQPPLSLMLLVGHK